MSDHDPMEYNGQRCYIVYPRRDRTKLTVVVCWDYEYDDYDIASQQSWTWKHEAEAQQYAVELAEKNGLTYVGDRDKLPPKYLD